MAVAQYAPWLFPFLTVFLWFKLLPNKPDGSRLNLLSDILFDALGILVHWSGSIYERERARAGDFASWILTAFKVQLFWLYFKQIPFNLIHAIIDQMIHYGFYFRSSQSTQLNIYWPWLLSIMMLVMVIINMAMTIHCMNMVVPQRLKFTTLVQPFLKWSHDLGDIGVRICRAEVYRAWHEIMKWSKSGLLDKKVLARPRLNHDQRITPHDTTNPNRSHPN